MRTPNPPGALIAIALSALAGMAGPAWSQVPAGPEFQVNTITNGRQQLPIIAVRRDGGFVVVWDDRSQYPVNPSDVAARRFSAAGVALGDEFRVNAFTTSAQAFSSGGVALDGRGNSIVVWTEFRSGIDIFARRVSAGGELLGDDFRVNPVVAGFQGRGKVAAAADGSFVVVWEESNGYDIMGRRFDAFGAARGGEFRVNTYTTGRQRYAEVASDSGGNFTVVWNSYAQDEPLSSNVYGQRYDAAGVARGGEFLVNTFTTDRQFGPAIAMNGDGAFVVAWEGPGPGVPGTQVWARRFSAAGAPLGIEFAVTSVTGGSAQFPALAIDEPGNFLVAWNLYLNGPSPFPTVMVRRYSADGLARAAQFAVASPTAPFVSATVASDPVGNFVLGWHDSAVDHDVFARRFGGLFPAGMVLNDSAGNGNGVLEVADGFSLVSSWRNLSGTSQTFQGVSSAVVAPPGLMLSLAGVADYGTVANGATGGCAVCFTGGLTGTRPGGHVDLTFVETIQPDAQGQAKRWALHVGDSFTDVPRASPFYPFVETLLHRAVTGGCGPAAYCPASSVSREQMAVFLLAAKEAAGYAPIACTTPVFSDVPASSPFCSWIEELARRGVTSGCGGGNYCPSAAVTREQMSVFVLRTLDPALNPPACTPPNTFNDVPETNPFCRWIEELARRGIAGGCGGGNYCPTAPVIREQMAVFLTVAFGLTLYGP